MLVRIRFGRGTKVGLKRRKNRRAALAAAALLTPAAVMAFVLGVWRLAADLRWTGEFAIPDGPLSHWQVWIAAALSIHALSRLLNRYGHGGDPGTPSR